MSKLIPTEGTKQLGIKFGDNDFYYTFSSFLRLLLPDEHTGHRASSLKFTKTQIVHLFNEIGHGLYMLKQNGWKYEDCPKDYLKINEGMVYLDEEVAEYSDKHRNLCNGDFFCIDFLQAYTWVL